MSGQPISFTRTLLLLAAIVASLRFAADAQTTAGPDTFVTTATTPQTIPSAFVDRVLVQGTIDGKSLWFTLDSGISGLVLCDEAARTLGLTKSSDGAVDADLTVGSLHAASAHFIVEGDAVDDNGYRVSGAIGAPLLLSNIVTIDYRDKRVVAYPGTSYDAVRVAQNAVPIELHAGLARIHAWFGGTRATMLFDTGAAQTVLFAPFAQAATVGPPLGQPKPITLGVNPTWTTVVEYGTKPMLLAGAEIGSPNVLVAGKAPAALPASLYDGVLGRDVARVFSAITFDYANSQVYFTPAG